MWVLGHRSSDHQTSLVTQDAGKEVNKAVPGNMKSPWSRDSNASWHLLLFKCWLVFLIIINLSNKKMKKILFKKRCKKKYSSQILVFSISVARVELDRQAPRPTLKRRARNLFFISRKLPLFACDLKGSLTMANCGSFWMSCHRA